MSHNNIDYHYHLIMKKFIVFTKFSPAFYAANLFFAYIMCKLCHDVYNTMNLGSPTTVYYN